MDHEHDMLALTRRGALMLAAGACVTGWQQRLDAFTADFWNKKEPAEWSAQEIELLTSKSPWSKEVSAHFARMKANRAAARAVAAEAIPVVAVYSAGAAVIRRWRRMGRPASVEWAAARRYGRAGWHGRRRNGRRAQRRRALAGIQGTVRWESAKPVLEAMKAPLPDTFANHYVIGVGGFPMMSGRPRSEDDDNRDSTAQASEARLDNLKSLTFLKPKDKEGEQPGLVLQQPSSGGGTYLFGFSKEMMALTAADKEVTFTTRIGRLDVKAKFNLKEMLYRGDLAV
jgi:hypothetical protein